MSYAVPKGKWKGMSLNASWSYVSGFVAQYEDAQRARLDFPGHSLVSIGVSHSIRRGKWTHSVGLSLRNALDYDLVGKQARLGAPRGGPGL